MGKVYFLLIILIPFISSCSNKLEAKEIKIPTEKKEVKTVSTENNQLKWQLPKIPDEITFAGEKVEFDDLDLKERLDYELIVNNYWHSNTYITMKLAHRWLPEMKAILKQEGVPEDLIYVAIIESGLRNVVSPAGAKGFWQFMESAGEEYGLIINSQVDERYHLEKSTRAACMYLKKAYRKFDSWFLAAAAYNRGMNGIQRDLEAQQVNNFFDLSLNSETARYIFRLFAVKLIFENPEEYGFVLTEEDLYPPYKTKDIVVDKTIESIHEWAIKHKVSTKIVRKLNPWIIGQSLEVKPNNKWIVKLPENTEQLRLIGG